MDLCTLIAFVGNEGSCMSVRMRVRGAELPEPLLLAYKKYGC